jgi:hypothetical protein
MISPFKSSVVLKVGDVEIVVGLWMVPKWYLRVAYPSTRSRLLG